MVAFNCFFNLSYCFFFCIKFLGRNGGSFTKLFFKRVKLKHSCVSFLNQDINECDAPGTCRNSEDICVNTRGSFRCQPITCPENYVNDPNHRK